jgi:hypothetical protein
MKTAAIIVSLIVVSTAILLIWSRSKRQEINSLWDVVRNPDAMPDLDDFHKEVDDAMQSLSGSPTKVAQLVDYFVFEAKSSRDAWTELRILAKLGNETCPRALEIRRDPSLKGRLTVLAEHPAWIDFEIQRFGQSHNVKGIVWTSYGRCEIAIPGKLFDRNSFLNPPRPNGFESTVENGYDVYSLARKQLKKTGVWE